MHGYLYQKIRKDKKNISENYKTHKGNYNAPTNSLKARIIGLFCYSRLVQKRFVKKM